MIDQHHASGERDAIEEYYDQYSTRYEGERREGYYAFVNDLEFEAVRAAATGARVLEIGSGTGLILERTAPLARSAVGVDLSSEMASVSRAKGLAVARGTADALPFPDDSFDLVYAFKVLPHVLDIQGALREVDRVLAPGGRAFLEFYSPTSLKHLANRVSVLLKGRTPVFVRYDGLGRVRRLLPAGMAVRSVRGVRILGPSRHIYTAPGLGPAAVRLEGRLSTSALARLGGYLVVEVGRGPEPRTSAKPRLVVVVKYHPPGRRISGIVGFLTALHRRLAQTWDLHVVSYETEGTGARTVDLDGYQVHRVGFPFPVTAWRRARALAADATLVVSGINDLRLAPAYFALLSSPSGRRDVGRRGFLQATHVAQPPPAAFARMVRRYDAVVCAGPGIHDDLAPVAGDRAVLVRPGVDVALLDGVRRAPKPHRLRYGFVNHLNPRKGADIAVAALARLAADCEDVDVVVAGTGPLQAELEARHGDADRVTFAGFLEDSDRLALMASCDVMLLPFRTGVGVLGVSQTVLECLALGVVVVGSRTAAIAPAIEAGTDGLLFDDGEDGEDMVRQLRLLHDDPGLLARLGAAARRRARRDFDVARVAEELTRLLAPSSPLSPEPALVAARGAT